MLDSVTATRFDRRAGTGRNRPCFVSCESATGDIVDVVIKFSGGCEAGVTALTHEAIASCLASDLDLPVPEPFLVSLTPEFIEAVPDIEIRQLMQQSVVVSFGVKKLPPQFSIWPPGKNLNAVTRDVAANILAFDLFIGNVDRIPENPNCQSKGDEIAIYDHELAFTDHLLFGWRPPWVPMALERIRTPGYHLFSDQLRRKPLALGVLANDWQGLSNERLAAYLGALPPQWAAAREKATFAADTIRNIRDNMADCVAELTRALA